jgi:hypothetical protein
MTSSCWIPARFMKGPRPQHCKSPARLPMVRMTPRCMPLLPRGSGWSVYGGFGTVRNSLVLVFAFDGPYPFDALSGGAAPDVVSGYDMSLLSGDEGRCSRSQRECPSAWDWAAQSRFSLITKSSEPNMWAQYGLIAEPTIGDIGTLPSPSGLTTEAASITKSSLTLAQS